MSIFAFCAFLPREFERNRTLSKKTIYRLRNRTLSKKTIYRLRKSLGWCIIKLKIRLRIFLYTPVLCLWSSDDRNHDEELDQGKVCSSHDVFLSVSKFGDTITYSSGKSSINASRNCLIPSASGWLIPLTSQVV